MVSFKIRRFQTLSALLSLLLLSTGAVLSQGISVQLDGRLLQFDQPPAMVGGRLMVPLRGIFEALKTDVVYDGATRSIQATKGSRVVQLQLGSRTAIIDGRTIFLDVPADTIGGRTMVPLRFVSEALGAEVKWDGASKTVKLSSSGSGDGGTVANPPSEPENTPSASGPRIDKVFHSGTTELKPGDSLQVIVYGEPGGKATFEILGATKQIALPEVSSGKYQTRWSIPNGLQVNKGVLLAHLEKNGRETASEASRQISVNGTGTSTPNQGSTWNLSPANGATISTSRPQVRLTFPSPIRPNSVRFFVDTVDFSNQVTINGNQLSWQPTYNLSSANHQAEVSAVSTQGQTLSQSWNFIIDPNSGNNNSSQGFQVSELKPAQGATSDSRGQLGARFNQSVRSIDLYVDGRQINNQAGLQRHSNGIYWTPNYDLSPGQHTALVKAVNQNGQVLNRTWKFVVSSNTISNFNVSPTTAQSGQQVKVTLQGPVGATGTFSIGSNRNLPLRETSSGNYEGVYTVASGDRGTLGVAAQLRKTNGQILNANAASQLTVQDRNRLTVSNLSNGMRISPVFNVQGTGGPGFNVVVLVEYAPSNILGAIAGQVKTIRRSTVVNSNGFYDVQVDTSVISPGQQFRVTVSDGQSPDVQLTLTRQ